MSNDNSKKNDSLELQISVPDCHFVGSVSVCPIFYAFIE